MGPTLIPSIDDWALDNLPSLVTGAAGQVWDVRGKLERNRVYVLVDVGERGEREPSDG